jgi:cytochrome c biogenesis protein CcmG/thiol:disulfide interchange protein DsbE
MNRIARTLLGITIAGLFAVSGGAEAANPPSSSLTVGTKAPDFKLVNLEGDEVTLYEILKEGPVLLDFWALWCKPCLKALPATDEISKKYEEEGVTVLTVNTDSPRSTAKVRSYVKSHGYRFQVLLDPNMETRRLFRYRSIPQLFLIASDGTIEFSKIGYAPGQERRIVEQIDQLLAKEAVGEAEGRGEG